MHPYPFEISMQTRIDKLIAHVRAFATADSVPIDSGFHALFGDSLSCQTHEKVALHGRRHPAQFHEVTAEQENRSQDCVSDLVSGSGDGFRLFRDSAVLSDRDTPLALRRQPVRQIKEQDDPPA